MKPARLLAAPLASAAAIVALCSAAPALAATNPFVADPYTVPPGQHATEVEPDTFSNGSAVVAAYQVGRISDGGATNIGFAQTSDGTNWTSGFLSGVTKAAGGSYDRATDASVAYDAKHGTWLISSLGLTARRKSVKGAAVLITSSTDGVNWPSTVAAATASRGQDFDKNWIVCDNTSSSPGYGNCYLTFDDFGHGDRMKFSRSTDGGKTWSAPVNTADSATGLGGQPVVQPNGTVVVPFANANETSILATTSTNEGASYGSSVVVSPITQHVVAANMRADALPSAEIDGAGKVYVVWQDCRFRAGCSSNDIVLSTSSDGTSWSAPTGVPIDQANSGVDHFTPGIAVNPATSGSGAQIGLTYYYFPDATCTSACQLDVGYISSANGGSTWGSPTQLAGPMTPTWLASTTQGYMAGDYISTSFLGSSAYPAFAIANAPSGGKLDERIATTTPGQAATGGGVAAFPSASAGAVPKTNPSAVHSAGHRAS